VNITLHELAILAAPIAFLTYLAKVRQRAASIVVAVVSLYFVLYAANRVTIDDAEARLFWGVTVLVHLFTIVLVLATVFQKPMRSW